MEQTELSRPRNSALALFLTFSRITLSGFGGLTFWTRYVLVERERWLTQREFLDLLVLAQLLPGPNALNLTVMVGYRFGRWTGAAAAVAGFLTCPCLVVIGLGVLYEHYGALPQFQRALTGMSIVAAGLLFSFVIKLAPVAPGPNAMYVTLIGWHVAGLPGVAATTLPLLVPASTLTLLVGHLYERYPNAPLGRAIRRGLAPITIGLMFASATILMRA